jgi:hypothetical protein
MQPTTITNVASYGGTPPTPSLPLFPGEAIVANYSSDPVGQAKVLRFSALPALIILAVILVPFLVIDAVSVGFSPIDLVFLFPFVLIGVLLTYASYKVGRHRPTIVYLTDRRIIVERTDPNPSAVAMGLENLGDVDVDQSTRAVRRYGVAWVYLLPQGTTQALVGRGRARRAGPGVIWIPGMRISQAQEMRGTVLRRANELRSKLGYPGIAPVPRG